MILQECPNSHYYFFIMGVEWVFRQFRIMILTLFFARVEVEYDSA